jgi:hypothetical protein
VPPRLVALGDSTVEGLMDAGPDGTFVGWADRFAHRLAERERGLLYANLGVRGQTAREVRDTEVIREAESRYGVLVVDFASEPLAGHPALWYDDRLHGNSEGHRRVAIALAAAMGLTEEDWRDAPPPVSASLGLVRIIAHELGWMRAHLTPWVWGRVRHEAYATGGRCKRPELLPVVAG